MAWRKWIVRGLVFTVAGTLAAAGLLYQQMTDPDAVRLQVLSQLGKHMPGAVVRLESARLQLLGGIAVSDAHLYRRDEPGAGEEIFAIPAATIYHDKQRLLDGKLAVRQIVLHRPTVHVTRHADGRWNLENVIAPPDLGEPVPTIVVKDGTLVFHDRCQCPGLPPVEFKNLNLTLINDNLTTDEDPLLVLHFQGTARSELLGPVEVKGTFHRRDNDVVVSVGAPAVPLGPALVPRLARYHAEAAGHLGGLEGALAVNARASYRPAASTPRDHEVTLRLTRGKLRHPQVPLPLEELEAVARVDPRRLRVEKLTAAAGKARLEATDVVVQLNNDLDLEGKARVEHLAVTPELLARLDLHELNKDYSPVGPVGLESEFRRRQGRWAHRSRVLPEDLTLTVEKYPHPLGRVTGTLDVECDPVLTPPLDRIRLDLTGYAYDRPVRIQGALEGARPGRVAVDISGKDLPITERILDAIPDPSEKIARAFHPTGLASFLLQLRRNQGEKTFQNRLLITVREATGCWDEFRYPFKDVSGVIDILPDHWEFRDFRATHKGGLVQASGRSRRTDQGERLEVELRGTGLVLDEELAAALPEGVKPSWKTFAPSGRLNFAVGVRRSLERAGPDDLDVAVAASGGAICPVFFAYPLEEVSARVRYYNRVLYLEDVRARHGDTAVTLGAAPGGPPTPGSYVYIKPGGGAYAVLENLQGWPVLPEAAFVKALPGPVARACEALELRDPLFLRTRLVIDVPASGREPADVYWNGGVALVNASLRAGVPLKRVTGQIHCVGRHDGHKLHDVSGNVQLDQAELFGQPLRQIHTHLQIHHHKPDILELPDLKARLYGGTVGGTARVSLPDPPRFELNLTALQVDLEQFGRHNQLGPDARLEGLAAARLFLRGEGTSLASLEGSGGVDVPSGKMYNLPPLLKLFKVLAGRLPDNTAFDEAHARFTVRGPRLHLHRLDLYGDAFSLGGTGGMALDGSDISLDFYAVWSHLLQALPPLLDKLTVETSKRILKIKLRGPLTDPDAVKEPVPVLVEPLKALLRRVRDPRLRSADEAPPQ